MRSDEIVNKHLDALRSYLELRERDTIRNNEDVLRFIIGQAIDSIDILLRNICPTEQHFLRLHDGEMTSLRQGYGITYGCVVWNNRSENLKHLGAYYPTYAWKLVRLLADGKFEVAET